MTQQQSNRETLMEARITKIEFILEAISESHLRLDQKLDRLSDEVAETVRAIRRTNTAVEQTNTSINMFVAAMIASKANDSDK